MAWLPFALYCAFQVAGLALMWWGVKLTLDAHAEVRARRVLGVPIPRTVAAAGLFVSGMTVGLAGSFLFPEVYLQQWGRDGPIDNRRF